MSPLPICNPLILSAVLVLAASGCSTQRSSPNIASSTRMSIADIAAAGGDTESSRAIMTAAAQSDPNNSELQLRLALAQLQAGRPDEAIATARRTADHNSHDATLLTKAGQLELRAGDPTLAAATFQSAVAQGAAGTSALNGLGVARVQLGDVAGAEDAFRKAIVLAPGDYAARNNLALALVLQGRADEAVPMLRSLADEPGAPDRVRHNLALAYTQRGEMQQAAALLTETVGRAAAGREVEAFNALRTEAPTTLAGRLAPVQVIEGRTSGVAYGGAIPGPAARSIAAASAGPPRLVEAAAKPVEVRAAPVAAVQAIPIAPPASKVVAAPPPATDVADAPTPHVITPTDPPPAEPGVATVGQPAAASPPIAGSPETAAAAPLPPSNQPGVKTITVFEPAEDGTIKVRIAAVPSRSAALTLWQNLAGLEPDLFNGRTPVVQKTKDQGPLTWHLGTGGFQDVAAAEQFCRQLRARGPNCKVGL